MMTLAYAATLIVAIILLPGIIECIRWQIVKYKDKRSLKK